MKKMKCLNLCNWLTRILRQSSQFQSQKKCIPLLSSPSSPPKGHLTVYVGDCYKEGELLMADDCKHCKYVVPVLEINHPLFWELLLEVEDEFEFQHPRGITIPCSSSRFEHVRKSIDATERGNHPLLTQKLRRKSFML